MAKFSSTLIEQASGKLGDNIVMRQTATGKLLCKAPRKASTPRRSEKQAYTRLQMANLLANYRLYSGKLAEAFENKNPGAHDANMFVSANWGHAPVYLTRPMRIQGACVLADDLFCIGSIDPIGYALASTGSAQGRLVTTLNLGIEITAQTTVAQFSGALMTAADDWREGDQITFFMGTQKVGTDGMPRAMMRSQKVILNLDDQTKLWAVVTSEGFSTVDGYLATGMVLEEMGCAWVHSRSENGGTTKVSTQRLMVVSEVLPQYQTYAAMKTAAESYGGINKSAVYLNPGSSSVFGSQMSEGGNTGSGFTVNGSTEGSGGSDSTGSEQGGSNENQNPNENPSQGGSETPAQGGDFTITAAVGNDGGGSVTIKKNGIAVEGSSVQASATDSIVLTAVEDSGYQFLGWADGNSDNPRTITPSADATFTASFMDLSNV